MMAANSPYHIDEEHQVVRSFYFETGKEAPEHVREGALTAEGINEKTPDSVEVEEIIEGCKCENTDLGAETTVHRGDKWWLKICTDCGGLYPRHNARADYL